MRQRREGAPDPAQAVVAELAGKLGLGAVELHRGARGKDRARAAGGRGVMEAGAIYIDDTACEAGSTDERQLIAHEMAHVAQAHLPADADEAAGARAEDEARTFAATFASSGAIAPLSVGLPADHVAGEGPAPAAPAGESDAIAPLLEAIHDARARDAEAILARIVATEPLQDTVARLDHEGALDQLFRALGPQVWTGAARPAMLQILAVRAPDANIATIDDQVARGLLMLDFAVSPAEARMVYQVLKAMAPDARAAYLRTPAGQLAFDKLAERGSIGLRISREFGFYDADVSALLAELDNLETWRSDADLKLTFYMLVQSGHGSDEQVMRFVRDNFDASPPLQKMFQELGFTAAGKPTVEEFRDTPNPRIVSTALKTFLAGRYHLTLGVAASDGFGKRTRFDDLSVIDLQNMFGGSLFGLRFADLPDGSQAKASLEVGLGHSEVVFDLPSAQIEAVDYLARGDDGSTMTVAVTGGGITGLHADVHWPCLETPYDQESIAVTIAHLGLDTVVYSSGAELAAVSGLALDNLHLDLVMGPMRDGKGFINPLRFSDEVAESLAAVTSATSAAIAAVTSVLSKPSTVADGAGGEKTIDTAGFVAQLQHALAGKLQHQLWVRASVGAVSADAIKRADGAATGPVHLGIEVEFAAGPAALAMLEAGRIQRAITAEHREPTAAETTRLADLAKVTPELESAQAQALLTALGLDPNAVEMEVRLDHDPANQLGVAGVGEAKVGATEIVNANSARVTVTFPGANAEMPPPEQAGDRVLYRIGLDVKKLDVPGHTTAELEGGTASVDALAFDDIQGTISVRSGNRLSVDATLGSAACGPVVYGALSLRPEGAIARGIHITGELALDVSGGAARIAAVTDGALTIADASATHAVLERTGAWKATMSNPEFHGITVTFDRLGGFAAVHVANGSVSGFGAALGGIVAQSDKPATFTDFDLAALSPGGSSFSIAALDANDVHLADGDKSVTIERVAAKIDDGFVDEDGNGSARVELSEPLELGAIHVVTSYGLAELASLTIPHGSVRVSYVSVGLGTGTVDDNARPVEKAVQRFTIEDLDVPQAFATGFAMDADIQGTPARIWLSPPGVAVLYGLRCESLAFTMSDDLFMVDGHVDIAGSMTRGLTGLLPEKLELALVAATGPIAIDAIGEKDKVAFTISQLQVDAGGAVNGGPIDLGGFRISGMGAETVEGVVGKDGAEVTAVNVAIGTVDFDDGNLWFHLDEANADIVVAGAGDRDPVKFPELELSGGGVTEDGRPILRFMKLDLHNAKFGVRDVPALLGSGPAKPLGAMLAPFFDSLDSLADQLHGDGRFKLHFQVPHVDVPLLPDGDTPQLPDSLPIAFSTSGGHVTVNWGGPPFKGRLFERFDPAAPDGKVQLALVDGDLYILGAKVPHSHYRYLLDPDAKAAPASVSYDPLIGVDDIAIHMLLKMKRSERVPFVDKGSLGLGVGSEIRLDAAGSTDSGAWIGFDVSRTDFDALVWDTMSLDVRGLEIHDAATVKVMFANMAPKSVEAIVRTGSVDCVNLFKPQSKP